jgi:hypothetical protein
MSTRLDSSAARTILEGLDSATLQGKRLQTAAHPEQVAHDILDDLGERFQGAVAWAGNAAAGLTGGGAKHHPQLGEPGTWSSYPYGPDCYDPYYNDAIGPRCYPLPAPAPVDPGARAKTLRAATAEAKAKLNPSHTGSIVASKELQQAYRELVSDYGRSIAQEALGSVATDNWSRLSPTAKEWACRNLDISEI